MTLIKLFVEREYVVDDSNAKQTEGKEVDQPSKDLFLIETMESQPPGEDQQQPCQIIICRSRGKPRVGFPIHRWNQECVDDPADTKKPESTKPQAPGKLFPEIEPVGAGETDHPQQIPDGFGMSVRKTDRNVFDVLFIYWFAVVTHLNPQNLNVSEGVFAI